MKIQNYMFLPSHRKLIVCTLRCSRNSCFFGESDMSLHFVKLYNVMNIIDGYDKNSNIVKLFQSIGDSIDYNSFYELNVEGS